MKKYLFALLIFYNCNNTLEIPVFESRNDALIWVNQSIEYKLRQDVDNWQTPEETLNLKSGICSDFSILLMYILKYQFDDNPELMAIHIDTGANHAIVKSGNNYYDPTPRQSYEYSFKIMYTVSYDYAIFWANLTVP